MAGSLDADAVVQAFLAQLETLGSVVEKLQSRVDELTSRMPTPGLASTPTLPLPTSSDVTPATEAEPTPANPSNHAPTAKPEKYPDPPMFDGNRKDLRPFITKLRLKLQMNDDRYPTERNKVAYGMSRLSGNAARTADPFYRNGTLNTLGNFIALLEQTYDDASREHTAVTKLESLRQRNREFTSFDSEFLGLVGELNWNEAAKVAALRRAISDEIRDQLVRKDLPGNFHLISPKFVNGLMKTSGTIEKLALGSSLSLALRNPRMPRGTTIL
jgi:hypothetical protein